MKKIIAIEIEDLYRTKNELDWSKIIELSEKIKDPIILYSENPSIKVSAETISFLNNYFFSNKIIYYYIGEDAIEHLRKRFSEANIIFRKEKLTEQLNMKNIKYFDTLREAIDFAEKFSGKISYDIFRGLWKVEIPEKKKIPIEKYDFYAEKAIEDYFSYPLMEQTSSSGIAAKEETTPKILKRKLSKITKTTKKSSTSNNINKLKEQITTLLVELTPDDLKQFDKKTQSFLIQKSNIWKEWEEKYGENTGIFFKYFGAINKDLPEALAKELDLDINQLAEFIKIIKDKIPVEKFNLELFKKIKDKAGDKFIDIMKELMSSEKIVKAITEEKSITKELNKILKRK